jgi:uncharacterized protein (TIGR00251 family)
VRTVTVKVTANAKKNAVTSSENGLKVHLTAPAVDGKANKALIELLAGHFKVKRSQIEITKGLKSKTKTITIFEVAT